MINLFTSPGDTYMESQTTWVLLGVTKSYSPHAGAAIDEVKDLGRVQQLLEAPQHLHALRGKGRSAG